MVHGKPPTRRNKATVFKCLRCSVEEALNTLSRLKSKILCNGVAWVAGFRFWRFLSNWLTLKPISRQSVKFAELEYWLFVK